MSSTTVAAISGKITARIASIHIDPACNTFLNDCFRQFGITVVPAEGDPILLLNRQKFEACVLRLYDPEADRILKAARNRLPIGVLWSMGLRAIRRKRSAIRTTGSMLYWMNLWTGRAS